MTINQHAIEQAAEASALKPFPIPSNRVPAPNPRLVARSFDEPASTASERAPRVLVQTVSMPEFERSGGSRDRVRALGRTCATVIGSGGVPGADADDAAAIRAADAGAIRSLVDGVAEAMRDGGEADAAD